MLSLKRKMLLIAEVAIFSPLFYRVGFAVTFLDTDLQETSSFSLECGSILTLLQLF